MDVFGENYQQNTMDWSGSPELCSINDCI